MSRIPVVAHHEPRCSARQVDQAERIAADLHSQIEGCRTAELRPLQAGSLEDLPTLHLDDLCEIRQPELRCDPSFLQDRARLRAGDGDLVAVHALPPDGYEEYCRERLRLGGVEWLQPDGRSADQLAANCWEDRDVRHELIRRIRRGTLRYVHPHLGTRPVWELAALLSEAAGRRVQVIAPLPGISRFANDKGAFCRLVEQLIGPEAIPRTVEVNNLSQLSLRVQELAHQVYALGIKLPDSAGGGGNWVLEAAPFRKGSLVDIREELKATLGALPTEGVTRLLVTAWESDVVAVPSVQTWIPPIAEGPPVVEGLFEQTIIGKRGIFVGSRPADLPAAVNESLVNGCWLLARVFQLLGYLGRCSFDGLLLESGRLELIECNGRWGGTSLPMTLMNRLFGDWTRRPYFTRAWQFTGLERVQFQDMLGQFQDDLFDARTGAGSYVFYNPSALAAASRVNALVLGDSPRDVSGRVEKEVREKLRGLVRPSPAGAERTVIRDSGSRSRWSRS